MANPRPWPIAKPFLFRLPNQKPSWSKWRRQMRQNARWRWSLSPWSMIMLIKIRCRPLPLTTSAAPCSNIKKINLEILLNEKMKELWWNVWAKFRKRPSKRIKDLQTTPMNFSGNKAPLKMINSTSWSIWSAPQTIKSVWYRCLSRALPDHFSQIQHQVTSWQTIRGMKRRQRP